jgi:hypothetical protein
MHCAWVVGLRNDVRIVARSSDLDEYIIAKALSENPFHEIRGFPSSVCMAGKPMFGGRLASSWWPVAGGWWLACGCGAL